MPPRTLPLASVANTTGPTPVVCSRAATGGRTPSVTHRSSQWKAASSTKWAGPVLIGAPHVNIGLGWLVGFCIDASISTAPWPSPVSCMPMSSP